MLVGVCAERSLELVVGLLGVLKAGGAYLPLDPEYPAARLTGMVADAGLRVVLTQRRACGGAAAAGGTCAVSLLDGDELGVATAAVGRRRRAGARAICTPGHLAYVIYTSGSTGQPKGVANTHEGLHNRLAWMQDAYGLTADDVVLQKTPFSFDVSVWEFFWPLMAGARLVVAGAGRAPRSGAAGRDRSREQGVTTLHFVPSMLQAFLEHVASAA